MGQLDLANASLASAAAGGAISPSMLAAQGKQMALAPPEMPALGPSMAQRRLMIEQVSPLYVGCVARRILGVWWVRGLATTAGRAAPIIMLPSNVPTDSVYVHKACTCTPSPVMTLAINENLSWLGAGLHPQALQWGLL